MVPDLVSEMNPAIGGPDSCVFAGYPLACKWSTVHGKAE
jgi:hypothetical protein